MLQIKLFTVNPIQENTYVVSDETKEAVIIDCGCFTEREWKTVQDYIEDQHLRPVHLLNTHLHFDHCLGNRFAVRDYHLLAEAAMGDYDLYSGMQAQAAMFMGNYYASHIDTDFTAQLAPALKEGNAIRFGSHTLTVIATPGHTPGGIASIAKRKTYSSLATPFSQEVLVERICLEAVSGTSSLPFPPNSSHYPLPQPFIQDMVLPLPLMMK